MGSIEVALDALEAAVELLGAADIEELAAPERFAAVERLERVIRRQVATSYEQITHLERYEGCPPIPILLADVLRISRAAANRRVRDAEQLAPRRSLMGEPLAPLLPETGKAWDAGELDVEHVRVIQKFFRDLPEHVGPVEVEKAERSLAGHAQTMRPDQLERVAERLAIHLNPDGKYSEEDRARKRGFQWCGGQRPDGMSVGKLIADPLLRGQLDAWFAKAAAPEPDDLRSLAQRQHDALSELVQSRLGDPKLGKHNGLPVALIATTTLQELRAGAGHAVTAGGTLIPITDLIRMNAPFDNYLAVFDGVTGKSLWLGRSKRLASADQRIMLLAKYGGCTAPGCTVNGYNSQVHHAAKDWKHGGATDIDDLTLACKCDNLLVENEGWTTHQLADGQTQWNPPPGVPLRGGTNDYHHPERLLENDSDPPSDTPGAA